MADNFGKMGNLKDGKDLLKCAPVSSSLTQQGLHRSPRGHAFRQGCLREVLIFLYELSSCKACRFNRQSTLRLIRSPSPHLIALLSSF